MGLPQRDPWLELSRYTAARIALGRVGGSVPSNALLEFRLAHARARDAVQRPFDATALCSALREAGADVCELSTLAADRQTFLLRPDLGRTLSAASRELIQARRAEWGERQLVLVVSDGLSALAAELQVTPLLRSLLPRLECVTRYPVFVVPYARVKLGDEIGQVLGARHSLILLGERPGLSAPDSLGAYLTYQPRVSCTDADRNCVSNIRPEGLPIERAASRIAALLRESALRGVSGVALKDVEGGEALSD